MDAFELSQVIKADQQAGQLYHEFIRSDVLSVGLYILPAGQPDPQQPHTEDEVYYIAEAKGVIKVGDKDGPVNEGSMVFVGTGIEHRFHSITEDLTVLVFFALARRSRASTEGAN
jgi:mannose-6-phosphate isomerase-like protein (cupin superfamily)